MDLTVPTHDDRLLTREECSGFGALGHSRIGMAVLDARGRILDANPTLWAHLDAERTLSIFPGLDDCLVEHFDRTFDTFHVDHRVTTRDGVVRALDVEISRIDDRTAFGPDACALALVTDVTGGLDAVERLTFEATHDQLTGLPNRAAFVEELRRTLDARTTRAAVLFLDLDEFKPVNDSLGHAAGDELLAATAMRLLDETYGRHFVARLHGDEFGFLLFDVDLDGAKAFAEAVRVSIRRPYRIAGREIAISPSIGLVMVTPAYRQSEAVLRDADAAMYRAKRLGRSRCEVFDEAMRLEAGRAARLRTDIHSALLRDEFRMVFQPVVDLSSGRAHGMEAFMRWSHPIYGEIAPTEFVALAEKSDSIVALGRFALDGACRVLASLSDIDPAFTVGVNLSVRHIREPEFVSDVERVLAEHALPGDRLLLEITETVMAEHDAAIVDAFWQLKALGVRLCVDDFGIGSSSLRYLDRFPIDLIKIDRAFITASGGESIASEPIVGMILSLAKALNMGVIAEGVESKAQAELLRVMGCSIAQGFFFAEPLPADGLRTWLARNRKGL